MSPRPNKLAPPWSSYLRVGDLVTCIALTPVKCPGRWPDRGRPDWFRAGYFTFTPPEGRERIIAEEPRRPHIRIEQPMMMILGGQVWTPQRESPPLPLAKTADPIALPGQRRLKID